MALEDRIPADHPLRGMRKLVDAVLAAMSKEFDGLYSQVGRPSIAPERLLRALLLQVFYSVRSERLLMEQLNYNLLFRWFVGLEIDDAVWNHAVFSKNRDRLLNQDLAQKFFVHVKEQAAGLMSDEHFTVDGTLIGRDRRAFAARTRTRPVLEAEEIFTVSRGETRPTRRAPIPRPGCIRSRRGRKPS